VISTQDIDRIIGTNAVDPDGEKIGKVDNIYLDDDSGEPEFALVNTGLFGMRSSFVPLRGAELNADGDLRVAHAKDTVKDAPNLDEDGHLEPEQERELFDYYGGSNRGRGDDSIDSTREGDHRPADARADDDRVTGNERDRDTVGHDTSGPATDDAMTRSEEELHVGTAERETGRARLRKHVVTEHVTKTVPVQREEVHVEREPITDGNVDAATDGPGISEEEHEVVLHEEEPVVEKRTVPKERVRLDKDVVTDDVEVEDDVRHEEIDVAGVEGSRRDVR
jgi:uncharacterized protein (TIGR02271 family)